MKFWDTSALIPLVIDEERSRAVLRIMFEDQNMFVSGVTRVEVASAITRRLRSAPEILSNCRTLVMTLEHGWTEIDAERHVLTQARRLAYKHALRSADAIQLACAMDLRGSCEFVTLDRELAVAAQAEGFAVLPAA